MGLSSTFLLLFSDIFLSFFLILRRWENHSLSIKSLSVFWIYLIMSDFYLWKSKIALLIASNPSYFYKFIPSNLFRISLMIFLSWSFQVENLLANYYRSDILANKSFKTKIYNRLYFIICLFKHSHIQHLIIHIQHLVIIESLIFLRKNQIYNNGQK